MKKDSLVDLSTYSSAGYFPGSLWRRVVWYLLSALFFETLLPCPSTFKVFLLRAMGAKIGRGVVIKPLVKIKYPWLLSVGNYVWIGECAWIDNLARVGLSDNCCVSQGAYLLTGNHDYKDSAFGLRVASIIVECGAWIGAKTVVCPGLTVREGAVLCAGSVAVKDLEAMKVYQGNPAVIVRERMVRKHK